VEAGDASRKARAEATAAGSRRRGRRPPAGGRRRRGRWEPATRDEAGAGASSEDGRRATEEAAEASNGEEFSFVLFFFLE
jgi:hypothetical protein